MDVPLQFRLSPGAQPVSYRRPGMNSTQLNARARADRKARVEALAEHDRKIDALFAEARQLTEGKWGTDHHHGVPKPRLIGAHGKLAAVRAKSPHLFGDIRTPTPKLDAFRAKHGHLFGDAPTASKTPRREPPRSLASRALLAKVALQEARITEREAAATSRRAEAALAKSLEPPLPVYLLDVEPIDFIGKEPCQLEKTWSNGERRWITYEWTAFGESTLAEGRYP